MFTHIGTPVTLPKLKSNTTSKGRYYTTPENNIYHSITTILNSEEKPWLEHWRNMLGPIEAIKETKKCSDRGSVIHELIEKYLNNEEDFTKGVKSEYVKQFNQLKPHLNHIDNIQSQEIALYSDKLKVAGRVDCVGEYDNIPSIIDFKTSNNEKIKEQIIDYFLQCTFYALAWFEHTDEPINNIIILMSVENGLVPLIFKDKIDNYVAPLLKRIHNYYLQS